MGKTCGELFKGLEGTIIGNQDELVTGLAYRSDKVVPGDAFFCIVGTVVDGHIIVGSTKYAGELISLPLINSTATKVETVSRMIHGENIVPLMQTAAVCTIALLNPDILFLTGSATLNVREKDIIDYCKQSIPENHMPVFRMQADIHEEYMTGIFSLTRQALKFKH